MAPSLSKATVSERSHGSSRMPEVQSTNVVLAGEPLTENGLTIMGLSVVMTAASAVLVPTLIVELAGRVI